MRFEFKKSSFSTIIKIHDEYSLSRIHFTLILRDQIKTNGIKLIQYSHYDYFKRYRTC